MQSRLSENHQSIHNLQKELTQSLTEKESIIKKLQQEIKSLSDEKYNLMSRLETARDRPDTDIEGLSLKV